MEPTVQTEAIRLRGVTKEFVSGPGKRRALADVECTLHLGEFCLVLGPSGSGKTTLLTIAAGLQRPSAGEVTLLGRAIDLYSRHDLQRLRAQQFGFVFQDFRLIGSLTVRENIALVLRFARLSRREIRERVAALLHEFDIEPLAGRYPEKLSQGEKQRVAIARAFANGARLLFADEPTASLDSIHGEEVIRRLANHAREYRACVVAVTHDLRLQRHVDRVFNLRDGLLVERGSPVDRLTAEQGSVIL